mmetsp:Transcript_16184/g.39804  ORF Transcript_16184/g.39804 Transcript_16184/m.39804 type:complete len:224 (+) Transcript_16184:753-1424(+)
MSQLYARTVHQRATPASYQHPQREGQDCTPLSKSNARYPRRMMVHLSATAATPAPVAAVAFGAGVGSASEELELPASAAPDATSSSMAFSSAAAHRAPPSVACKPAISFSPSISSPPSSRIVPQGAPVPAAESTVALPEGAAAGYRSPSMNTASDSTMEIGAYPAVRACSMAAACKRLALCQWSTYLPSGRSNPRHSSVLAPSSTVVIWAHISGTHTAPHSSL